MVFEWSLCWLCTVYRISSLLDIASNYYSSLLLHSYKKIQEVFWYRIHTISWRTTFQWYTPRIWTWRRNPQQKSSLGRSPITFSHLIYYYIIFLYIIVFILYHYYLLYSLDVLIVLLNLFVVVKDKYFQSYVVVVFPHPL